MNQLNEGGCASKGGRIFPIPRYLKMTPIVLCFSASFCPAGAAGEKRGVLFLSDLGGEQIRRGNSEGALFWLCSPMFDQQHGGP